VVLPPDGEEVLGLGEAVEPGSQLVDAPLPLLGHGHRPNRGRSRRAESTIGTEYSRM